MLDAVKRAEEILFWADPDNPEIEEGQLEAFDYIMAIQEARAILSAILEG